MIFSVCSAYISSFGDAHTNLRHIMIEVGSLKCVLAVVRVLILVPNNEENSASFKYLSVPAGLHAYERVLADLSPEVI